MPTAVNAAVSLVRWPPKKPVTSGATFAAVAPAHSSPMTVCGTSWRRSRYTVVRLCRMTPGPRTSVVCAASCAAFRAADSCSTLRSLACAVFFATDSSCCVLPVSFEAVGGPAGAGPPIPAGLLVPVVVTLGVLGGGRDGLLHEVVLGVEHREGVPGLAGDLAQVFLDQVGLGDGGRVQAELLERRGGLLGLGLPVVVGLGQLLQVGAGRTDAAKFASGRGHGSSGDRWFGYAAGVLAGVGLGMPLAGGCGRGLLVVVFVGEVVGVLGGRVAGRPVPVRDRLDGAGVAVGVDHGAAVGVEVVGAGHGPDDALAAVVATGSLQPCRDDLLGAVLRVVVPGVRRRDAAVPGRTGLLLESDAAGLPGGDLRTPVRLAGRVADPARPGGGNHLSCVVAVRDRAVRVLTGPVDTDLQDLVLGAVTDHCVARLGHGDRGCRHGEPPPSCFVVWLAPWRPLPGQYRLGLARQKRPGTA